MAKQNPRGIKVDPAGDNATDELALYRENRIRAIEYACNAPQVYIQGLQSAVERNIGYWKVSRRYVSDDSDDQEILVLPVMNPDMILIDPDYKELDESDIGWAFEIERLSRSQFKRDYPDAEEISFAAEGMSEDASAWADEKSVMVVSYRYVDVKQEKRRGTGRDCKRCYGVAGVWASWQFNVLLVVSLRMSSGQMGRTN